MMVTAVDAPGDAPSKAARLPSAAATTSAPARACFVLGGSTVVAVAESVAVSDLGGGDHHVVTHHAGLTEARGRRSLPGDRRKLVHALVAYDPRIGSHDAASFVCSSLAALTRAEAIIQHVTTRRRVTIRGSGTSGTGTS